MLAERLVGFPQEMIIESGLTGFLERTCFEKHSKESLPRLEFWKDRTQQTNVAGSTSPVEMLQALYMLFAESGVKAFPPDASMQNVEAALELIKREPHSRGWLEFCILYAGLPVNRSIREKFHECLALINFPEFHKLDPKMAETLLRFTADQALAGDAESRTIATDWLKLLTGIAARRSAEAGGNTDIEDEQQLAFLISDVASLVTVEPYDPIFSSARWNDLIFELGEAWPQLAVWLDRVFFRLWVDKPIDQIQGIGKNILRARAIR
jgi:hypothetical protein